MTCKNQLRTCRYRSAWLFVAVIASLHATVVRAQEVPSVYLEEALRKSPALLDRQLSLGEAINMLRQARSLFLPSMALEGQYTIADGGRSIDIPVGSLLNPVYQALNQLTGSDKFPSIPDVSEQLNPDNFTDIRLRTVMPLYNPDLRYNRAIRQHEIRLKQFEVDTYKRHLVKEVKQAYYQYLMSTESIRIITSSLEVVRHNLTLNQSLLRHGKGLPAYVSRAENEVRQVETMLMNAANEQRNARAYFNFLLSKPLGDSISQVDSFASVPHVDSLILTPSGIREELRSTSAARDISRELVRMNKSQRLPRVNLFLDAGTQAFDFRFDERALYYIGGVQVKVPLFSGRLVGHRIEQSELAAQGAAAREKQVQTELELAAFTSRNNVMNAYNSFNALLSTRESASKYFNLIDRGYREGINSFIEFLDARNQLTTTLLQLNIYRFRLLIALAEYERQTASFPIPSI